MSTTTKHRGGRPPKAIPHSPQIAARLRKTSRGVSRAETKLAEEVRERDAAVREAVAAGWSHSAVADEIGKSKGLIGQILR